MLKVINHKLMIPFSVGIGILGGYLNWYIVGCPTGSCPVSSNPIMNMVTGGLIGLLVINAIQSTKSKN